MGISKCQTGEEKLMGHWSTLPFLDFLFFLWKELITATKRVKKGERWGRRKGEKISRQSIKSYKLSIMLWTVRNLGKGLSFTKMPHSLQPQRMAKQTKGWKLSLLTLLTCYWQIFTWKNNPILWYTLHLNNFYSCRVSLKDLSPSG